MSETWDAAGYVTSSRYRLSVCRHLSREGPDLPSRIAEELDLAQPHVSRALSELRERGVVELLVPESQQKGRLYGLTDDGRRALVRLRGEAAAVNVEFVEESKFPHAGLLDYLLEAYESEFRLAIAHNGDRTDVYRVGGSTPESRDETSISRLVALLGGAEDRDRDDAVTGRTEFVVRGFEEATLVRLLVDDGEEVYLSLDRGADLPLESFVEDCRTHLSAEN
jgi:DNA-binding MarR family transcriptional regulator